MNSFIKAAKKSSAFRLPLILIVILAGAIFLYRSWHPGSSPDSRGRASNSLISEDAPPFLLMDARGEQFPSSMLLGKPAVLNFFATWCPSCREEIPGFIEVYEKYKGNGFELIGISLDADPRAVPAFVAERKIQYRVLLGTMETVKAYGSFRTVPTTFFLGKDGKIKNILMGYLSKEVFEEEVRKLL